MIKVINNIKKLMYQRILFRMWPVNVKYERQQWTRKSSDAGLVSSLLTLNRFNTNSSIQNLRVLYLLHFAKSKVSYNCLQIADFEDVFGVSTELLKTVLQINSPRRSFRIISKTQRKISEPEFLFNKFVGLQPATLLKRELRHRLFWGNIEKEHWPEMG